MTKEIWEEIQIEAMAVRGITGSTVMRSEQKALALRAVSKKLSELAVGVDTLADREALDHIVDVPFVFWKCPGHREQSVMWEHLAKDLGGITSIATCHICGRKSTDPKTPPPDSLSAEDNSRKKPTPTA